LYNYKKEVEAKFSVSSLRNFTFKREIPEVSFGTQDTEGVTNFLPNIDYSKHRVSLRVLDKFTDSSNSIMPHFSRTSKINRAELKGKLPSKYRLSWRMSRGIC
jgi:hypothetical protein